MPIYRESSVIFSVNRNIKRVIQKRKSKIECHHPFEKILSIFYSILDVLLYRVHGHLYIERISFFRNFLTDIPEELDLQLLLGLGLNCQ